MLLDFLLFGDQHSKQVSHQLSITPVPGAGEKPDTQVKGLVGIFTEKFEMEGHAYYGQPWIVSSLGGFVIHFPQWELF